MEKRFVYADNAATTRVKPEVFAKMIPYFTEHYGNPSSIYSIGRDSAVAILHAREKIAQCLNCDPNEIIFTSGGSESDNAAITGIAKKRGKGHIITSKIEHHAVLHTVQALEKEGFEATYLDVDGDGIISLDALRAAIREDTILITIMYANNEIGSIQPIKQIGEIAREHKIPFHTDAVQAAGHLKIDVRAENIDMLSLSAHKFGGPKGTGVLYVKRGINPKNLILGGGQERGKRAGTENIAGIIGTAEALSLTLSHIDEVTPRVTAMRDRLIDGILKNIPYTRLNGGREHRLPGNVNISVEYIEGESLILLLDLNGICASSGSACTTGSLDPSHVLLALGLTHEVAHGSLRLTINDETTDEDIDYILEVLPKVVDRLRAMSPVWENRPDNKNK
ncbi:MAG: cysteine desulfurase NifS [Clostridia bacterium]|nr:cysteine desulfurase NifS [Clostridia bacterium]